MAERTKYPPNTFCWPELLTTNAAGAKKFYAGLFGWELTDSPVGPDAVYTMAGVRGKNAAAMYEMDAERKKQEHPPAWLSYVSVENLDASVAKAKGLGAKMVVDAMDVMDIGRMAVLRDPQDGVVALWQPIQQIGAQIVNEPGTLCWNELHTHDVDGSGAFYTKLFDWSVHTDKGKPPYTMFKNGERGAGGMIEIQEEWGDVPTHWMVYFAVDDCDAALEKAKSLGGREIVPPVDVENVGRFAMLCDPQGAAFAIVKLDNPPD